MRLMIVRMLSVFVSLLLAYLPIIASTLMPFTISCSILFSIVFTLLCLTYLLYIAIIARLVNKKIIFFLSYRLSSTASSCFPNAEIASAVYTQDEQLYWFCHWHTKHSSWLQLVVITQQLDKALATNTTGTHNTGVGPEQLYGFSRSPKTPNKKIPGSIATGAGSLGRKPDHGPTPKAESSPNPKPEPRRPSRTRTILLEPPDSASSPRPRRTRGVNELSVIRHYILWIMLYCFHIWCYVTHTALCKPLKILQFLRDFFFCGRCDVLFENVLLVDK